MKARAEVVVRPARVLAAVVLLLCAFGLAAPAVARAAAQQPRAHAVNVVHLTTTDQSGTALRLDQPQLGATAPPAGPAEQVAGRTAHASTIFSTATVDSARTRGPPPDAGH
jgi:hypothetical protein